MNSIPHLSNSAIPVARDDLERILQTLISFQQASGLAASIIIDRLNAVDGDPEAESGHDVEDDFVLTDGAVERATSDPAVDFVDQDAGSYLEWHTLHARQKGGPCLMAGHEDDEEDDPPEEDDPSGQSTEDEVSYGDPNFGDRGPGCPISDPGEQEEDIVSCYGVDQTAGIVSNWQGLEKVQDFPCGEIGKRPDRGDR